MITCTIESPFAGNVTRNKLYLSKCILHCLDNRYAPFASHEMFTRTLDDFIEDQRKLGILAGFYIAEQTAVRLFFVDFGVSRGMREGHKHARSIRQPYRFVSINRPHGWKQSKSCGIDEPGFPFYEKDGARVIFNPDEMKWTLVMNGTHYGSHAELKEAVNAVDIHRDRH